MSEESEGLLKKKIHDVNDEYNYDEKPNGEYETIPTPNYKFDKVLDEARAELVNVAPELKSAEAIAVLRCLEHEGDASNYAKLVLVLVKWFGAP